VDDRWILTSANEPNAPARRSGQLSADLFCKLAWPFERVESVEPSGEQPNLGPERLGRLLAEGEKHEGLRCTQALMELGKGIGAPLGGDNSANSPIRRMGRPQRNFQCRRMKAAYADSFVCRPILIG
jgi:hypothetical protein